MESGIFTLSSETAARQGPYRGDAGALFGDLKVVNRKEDRDPLELVGVRLRLVFPTAPFLARACLPVEEAVLHQRDNLCYFPVSRRKN